MTPSLAEQLGWAARLLHAVQQGRSLNDALPTVPAPQRPGVQALTYHALRHWGQATALSALLAERVPAPPVGALLGMALTLLLDLPPDAGQPRYAAHTVVDQTVQALGWLRAPKPACGFVNACLRRFLREREALQARLAGDAVARWNHPFWWIRQIRRDHPRHWQAILTANNHPAPMVLRVNRRRIDRPAFMQALQAQGIEARSAGADGVVLARAVAVERLPGWTQGWCSVQDMAAQMAAPLLLGGADLPPGARVLDACAAPGGKTAHLLESSDAEVLALDKDPTRCERITDNLTRLGLQAQVRTADAGEPQSWWDGRPFDAILLDAPCTASGIVRRHPDVRWLRRPEDIGQLVAQQRRLLDALWPLLRSGGRLLYATCSVFRAEGQLQIETFLQHHTHARLLPSPGHLLPGETPEGMAMDDNLPGGHDGFFYALLEKSAAS